MNCATDECRQSQSLRYQMKSLLLIISCAILANAFPLTAWANDLSNMEWQALLAMSVEARKTGICYVHKTQMRKKDVPIRWGFPSSHRKNEPTSIERMQLFPFAIEYFNGGCSPIPEKKTEKIYICKECQNAEALWFEQNMQK